MKLQISIDLDNSDFEVLERPDGVLDDSSALYALRAVLSHLCTRQLSLLDPDPDPIPLLDSNGNVCGTAKIVGWEDPEKRAERNVIRGRRSTFSKGWSPWKHEHD
jgi:hypothetical protein